MSESNIGALVRAYEKAVAAGFVGDAEAFASGITFRKSLKNLAGYNSNGTAITPATLSSNRHGIPLADGESRNIISQLEYLDGWREGNLYVLWDEGGAGGSGNVRLETAFGNQPSNISLNGFLDASNTGVTPQLVTASVGAANVLQKTLIFPNVKVDPRYPFRARLRRVGGDGLDTFTGTMYIYALVMERLR